MTLSIVLSCFLLWSLASTTTAFNITKILDQHSDYATFNQLLSQTHVAGEVNKRKSVTVLVVPNGAVAGISSQKADSLKSIMKIHVVLDFYDSAKIKKLKDGTKLTTLYQTTGSANKDEGFLKVKKDNHDIKLGSAVSGAQMSAKVNKVVTSISSDISVVEIASPIVPSEINGASLSKSKSSPSSSPSPSSDSSSSSSLSPSSGSSPSPSKSRGSTDGPSKDDSSSDSPAPAPAPTHKHKRKRKHAPASAPSPSDEDSPSDDGSDDSDDAADDEDSPSDDEDYRDEDDSSSTRNAVVSGVMLLASFIAAL